MDILKQKSTVRENLGMLTVLEALDGDTQFTQRELAQETGLNLKKVNYCLHKLFEKGYVKFQRVRKNPNKRAYFYILTPDGLQAKSKLTYDFVRFTFDFYNKVEEKLRKCIADLAHSSVSQLVLYGASDAAKIFLDLMGETDDISVVCVLDDHYPGKFFQGVAVIRSTQLYTVDWDGILITTLDDLELTKCELLELQVQKEKIWTLS